MRVVVASRIFAPEAAAAAFRLTALTRALDDAGDNVTVLTSTSPDGAASGLPDSVRVRRAPVLRDRSGAVRGYVQYLSFDIPLFFRLLFIRRPDVVVVEPPPTTGAAARVACGIRRIPYVYYAADLLGDAAASAGAPGFVVKAVRALERWVLRGAAAVLSVSDGVTARLADLGIRDSVHTVGNGVDARQFSANGPVTDIGAPYLVYAGTASEVHGATIFVEAFEAVLQRHPDARLVFMGHGSDRDRLRELARRLPAGAVLFEPRRPAAEVAGWLRGATASLASVKPGLGYDFAFPTKMYASLACGTPVIYAGGGPGRAFVQEHDVGWSADYRVEDVAAAMIAALDAPHAAALREQTAAWARDNVTLDAVAERAVEAIREALPGG